MCQFLGKMDKFDFFGQNLVFGLKFRKQKLKKESESTKYHVYQFSDKTEKFDFFVSNLPEMDF